jgi:DNA-binding beta-propeller fold protein YncE
VGNSRDRIWGILAIVDSLGSPRPTGHTVTEIEASTGRVVRTIAVGAGAVGISADGSDVWVADSVGNAVTQISASTGRVIRTIGVGAVPSAVSSDGSDVWVANVGPDAKPGHTVTEIRRTPPRPRVVGH